LECRFKAGLGVPFAPQYRNGWMFGRHPTQQLQVGSAPFGGGVSPVREESNETNAIRTAAVSGDVVPRQNLWDDRRTAFGKRVEDKL